MPHVETITVPVTSFVEAGAGLCGVGELTQANLSGRVTLVDIDSSRKKQRLQVRNPDKPQRKILLNFNVVPATGTTGSYTVCGLAITNNGLIDTGPGAPANNDADFEVFRVNSTTLSLMNNYKRGGQTDGTTRWKLYILVMKDGKVGVIDPEIDNTETPS